MEEEAGVVIIIIIINSTSTGAPSITSNANPERQPTVHTSAPAHSAQRPSVNSNTQHYHYVTHKAAVRANKKEKIIVDHAGAKPSNVNCTSVNDDCSTNNNDNNSSINRCRGTELDSLDRHLAQWKSRAFPPETRSESPINRTGQRSIL